jgi:hypothetical protein
VTEKPEQRVCVGDYASVQQAEETAAALSAAGITAIVQGLSAGHLMGDLVPERFPVWVASEQAVAASALLAELQAAALETEAASFEPRDRHRGGLRRNPVLRAVLGFYVFTLLAFMVLCLAFFVVASVADALHATPYGHVIRLPIPLGYVVCGLALLLTVRERLRDRAFVIIALVTILISVASVRVRHEPASTDIHLSRVMRFVPW